MSFNQSLFNAIHNLAGKSGALDIVGIFLAQYLAYFLIVGFLIALFFVRDWRLRFYQFALAGLAVILARGVVVELIRFLYYRPRPSLVLSFEALIANSGTASFPSGHAAVFFALGAAVYYLNKKWGIFLITAALVIGIARIFVGVHWPMDILAGAVTGVLSAILSHWLLKDVLEKIKTKPIISN